MQPGGHIENTDINLNSAAKGELFEETGVNEVKLLPFDESLIDLPFDIDIHSIPEDELKKEPEHIHVDFRHIFVLRNEVKANINIEEISEFVWKDIYALEKSGLYINRSIRKILKILKNNYCS